MDGIFGVDWNQDGQVDIVEDMITADVLGLFDEEEKNEDDGEDDQIMGSGYFRKCPKRELSIEITDMLIWD